MARDIERVYGTLLDAAYQTKLFGDLEGFQEKGQGAITRCPFHADTLPTLVVYADRPEYFCFVCSARGDWIRYLMLQKGMSFPDALGMLAGEAGMSTADYREHQWQNDLSRSAILEIAAGFFTTQLFSRPGEEVLHYLYGRGYAMGEVEGSSFGYYPGFDALREYLLSLGMPAQQLDQVLRSIWMTAAEDFRLAIPYRDSCGRLMGFMGRDVRKKGPGAYRPLTDLGLLADVPFLTCKARGRDEVIVVEGLFDALLVDQIGFKPAVAIGKSGLTEGQLETLASCGIRRFILCLGSGTEKMRLMTEAAGLIEKRGFEAPVLLLDDAYEDLDHFIRSTDLHDFRKLLRTVRRKQPQASEF